MPFCGGVCAKFRVSPSQASGIRTFCAWRRESVLGCLPKFSLCAWSHPWHGRKEVENFLSRELKKKGHKMYQGTKKKEKQEKLGSEHLYEVILLEGFAYSSGWYLHRTYGDLSNLSTRPKRLISEKAQQSTSNSRICFTSLLSWRESSHVLNGPRSAAFSSLQRAPLVLFLLLHHLILLV